MFMNPPQNENSLPSNQENNNHNDQPLGMGDAFEMLTGRRPEPVQNLSEPLVNRSEVPRLVGRERWLRQLAVYHPGFNPPPQSACAPKPPTPKAS